MTKIHEIKAVHYGDSIKLNKCSDSDEIAITNYESGIYHTNGKLKSVTLFINPSGAKELIKALQECLKEK